MSSPEPGMLRPSPMGIVACVVGAVMLAIQIGVLGTLAAGGTNGQGAIYAFSVPFGIYLVGVPMGVVFAIMALAQPGRTRTAAKWGLLLTLLGPLVFVAWCLSRN